MEESILPLLNRSVFRKLSHHKRQVSQPPVRMRSCTESYVWLPNHNIGIIQEINKAKSKVHLRKSSFQSQEIVSLKDSVGQNKKFNRQLKFLLHRSKNPELIAAISKKKVDKIPRFQMEKETSIEHERAVECLKRKVAPKWKLYTKKRIEHAFSLRDSFINLRESKDVHISKRSKIQIA